MTTPRRVAPGLGTVLYPTDRHHQPRPPRTSPQLARLLPTPPADILPLKQGEGYLVVRRRLPAPAPTSPAAHLGAAGSAAFAGAGWTPADEARYQHSLQQLHALVALRHQAWPQIQAWMDRRAASSSPGAGGIQAGSQCSSSEQLAHWATMQRLRQLQHIQRQWQRLQTAKRQLATAQAAAVEPAPAPEQPAAELQPPLPAQRHAPTVPPALAAEQRGQPAATQQQGEEADLEASIALMQLAGDTTGSMPPPPPRPPRHPRQPTAAAFAASQAQPGGRPAHLHLQEQGWDEPLTKRRCLRGIW